MRIISLIILSLYLCYFVCDMFKAEDKTIIIGNLFILISLFIPYYYILRY